MLEVTLVYLRIYLYGVKNAQAFVDNLRQAANRFYGTLIRHYLKRITENLNEIGTTVYKAITGFVQDVCPAQADGQVKRVAARFRIGGCSRRISWRNWYLTLA